MRRQVTPADRKDTAIGMKMITLKAVLHRIRSESTAKIRPRAVTMLGAKTTQMNVFLIAVRVASEANIVW
jgi:hypothetical protein